MNRTMIKIVAAALACSGPGPGDSPAGASAAAAQDPHAGHAGHAAPAAATQSEDARLAAFFEQAWQARIALSPRTLLRNYVRIGFNPRFLRLALAGSIGFGGIFLYISSAPAIVMQHLHLGEGGFAWLFIPTIGGMTTDPVAIMLIVMVFVLLCGLFIDTLPAVIILVPVLAPLSDQFGIHPLHFAMAIVLNLTVGLATPPVGGVLFVMSSVARLRIEELTRAILPLLLVGVANFLFTRWIPGFYGESQSFVPAVIGNW
mgnify:CR=1 FL=1